MQTHPDHSHFTETGAAFPSGDSGTIASQQRPSVRASTEGGRGRGGRWAGVGKWAWLVGMLLAGLVGAGLRLVDLDNRPMHADEAVQAVRFSRLLEQGQYQYDPEEYHGPALPYLSLLAVWWAGIREAVCLEARNLRIVPAAMGILLVLGPWCLRRSLGGSGALLAAWATAISPAMVFYSRYYIAEMLLVGFTWGAVVGLWWVRGGLATAAGGRGDFSPTQTASKSRGTVAALLLLGVCVGMMHATKETFVIPLASMAVAAVAAMPSLKGIPKGRIFLGLAGVVLAAAGVSAAFFSSFGQHPAGILDSVKTYLHYIRQAGGEGRGSPHVYPFDYYFRVLFAWQQPGGLWWSEASVLGLALVGMIAGLLRWRLSAEEMFLARFLGIYTLFQSFVYSAIPYKTPWCALGFYHGMFVLAGVGGAALWRWAGGEDGKTSPDSSDSCQEPMGFRGGTVFWNKALRQGVLGVVFALFGAHLLGQAYRASFQAVADPTQPYLYAPTTQEVNHLVATLERLADCSPEGRALPIQVFFPDHQYWPLPWYLRRFSRVGWFGSFEEAADSLPAPVILASPAMEGGVMEYVYHRQPPGQRRLYMTGLGQQPCRWEIRPHVPLELYLRWDLWEACAEAFSSPAGREAASDGSADR